MQIENLELWQKIHDSIIFSLKKGSKFSIKHVKGHSTSIGNQEADRLANVAVRSL